MFFAGSAAVGDCPRAHVDAITSYASVRDFAQKLEVIRLLFLNPAKRQFKALIYLPNTAYSDRLGLTDGDAA